MIVDRKIRPFFLIVCSILLTGCGTTTGTMPAQRVVSESVPVFSAAPTDHPVEAAILLQIPSMKTGENGTAGSAMFIAGTVYVAASGRRCRSVAIDDGGIRRERVACESGPNWFFSKSVFVKGASE